MRLAALFTWLARLPLFFPTDPSADWGADDAEAGTEAGTEAELPAITRPPCIDLKPEAAKEKYRSSGRLKISRFPKRDPGKCKAIIVHQTGVERAIESTRYDKTSSHYVIRRDGAILYLFGHEVRLVSANSLDRYPWRAINIEIAGNFEGEDGSGRWFSPERMGKGRMTDAQGDSLEWLIGNICKVVEDDGGAITHVMPHRVSGRNKKGKPNRQICPGQRAWQRAETTALELGLKVPGPKQKFGGLAIPKSWRSALWLEMNGAKSA